MIPIDPLTGLTAKNRGGLYHPRVNANGTDAVGYICESPSGENDYDYVFCAGFDQGVVLARGRDYTKALKALRAAERKAWANELPCVELGREVCA